MLPTVMFSRAFKCRLVEPNRLRIRRMFHFCFPPAADRCRRRSVIRLSLDKHEEKAQIGLLADGTNPFLGERLFIRICAGRELFSKWIRKLLPGFLHLCGLVKPLGMEKLFRFVPERLSKIVGIEFADLLVILGRSPGKLRIRAIDAAQPVAHVESSRVAAIALPVTDA